MSPLMKTPTGALLPITRTGRGPSGTRPIPTPHQGPGRQFLYTSDWWTHILTGATSTNPNLDNAANIATLRRLAARYDVISLVSPHWHTVGTQVRDRLRLYAQEQGRRITILRYMGGIYARWTDQAGDMSLLPAAGVCTTTGTIQDASRILTTSSGAGIRGKGNGQSYLIDRGAPTVRSACASNAVTKAAGWDGIFIDEVLPSYQWMRSDTATSNVDPDYPLTNSAYETATRGFMQHIVSALGAAGKTVAANVDPYTTVQGKVHWPTVICQDNPDLRFPFVEAMWAADWTRTKMTGAHAEWAVDTALATWLQWAQTRGHEPIMNTYTRDPDLLRYGSAMTWAHGGRTVIVCGDAPNPDTDEYNSEPAWLPEYDKAKTLGTPTGTTPTTTGSSVTRAWTSGLTVTVDTSTGVGGVLQPGEQLPPPPSSGPTPPTGTAIFAEPFSGTDGAAWPATRWKAGLTAAGATCTIQAGRGRIVTGTTKPGQVTIAHTNTIGNFHALLKWQIDGSPVPHLVFRAAQQDVNTVSCYSLEVSDYRLALLRWGADWTDTQLAQVDRAHQSGTEWWVRLSAAGSTIRAKSWRTNSTEPAAWDINVTDTAYASGWWGFNVWSPAAAAHTLTVDDVTVAQS